MRHDATGNRPEKEYAGHYKDIYLRDPQGNVMAVYRIAKDSLYLYEIPLYGSSRLGVIKENKLLKVKTAQNTIGVMSLPIPVNIAQSKNTTKPGVYTMGKKHYESVDWLGNVRVTYTDKKSWNNGKFALNVSSSLDYYPFGSVMEGRKYNLSAYRYAFNTQERMPELNESHYTALYWEYDGRLARRWNVDPVMKEHESVYAAFANNPVWFVDLFGNNWYISNKSDSDSQPVWLPNEKLANEVFGENGFIDLGENLLPELIVTPEGSSIGDSYNVPNYLINAKGEYGQKEIEGDEHNPRILEYHSTTQNPETGKPYTDDETAWCASFCNWNLVKSGYPSNENKYNATATSYNKWNPQYTKLDKPALGAMAVIKTGKNYHVTFVIGINGDFIHGYGGNQGNQVKVSTYKKIKVEGYYVPVGLSPNYNVPIIKFNFNNKNSESTR